jgi:hypothetical protein
MLISVSGDVELIFWEMQLEPPMSDWFRSLPYSLDSIASAVKVSLLDVVSLPFRLQPVPVPARYIHWPHSLLSAGLFPAKPDVRTYSSREKGSSKVCRLTVYNTTNPYLGTDK